LEEMNRPWSNARPRPARKQRFQVYCIVALLLCGWTARGSEESHVETETELNVLRQWDFDRSRDSQGWSIPESLAGGIEGGCLRVTIRRSEAQAGQPTPASLLTAAELWGPWVWPVGTPPSLESPAGLNLPAAQATKIRLRLLNRSPETDGLVYCRTIEQPERLSVAVRFTMEPDSGEWQDVVCNVDGRWSGTIDRIVIQPALLRWRGDIWFDKIAIARGAPEPAPPRPDVCSPAVVPRLTLPGIAQAEFQDAFTVLDECLVTDVPAYGFSFPFMGPGGAYGPCWWALDTSLNLAGAKWANQTFAEDVMRGFAGVQRQNPDGRIDLYGASPIRGQVGELSSLPRYFEAAYDVARRTDDSRLRAAIHDSMHAYLNYWLSPVKRNLDTGLVTGVFEESLGQHPSEPQRLAPVDLNVAVAVGCLNAAQLARGLGRDEAARTHEEDFETLRRAINETLWSPEQQAYLNYDLRQKRHTPQLLCTTFDPLRAGIVPDDRVDRLCGLLTDPALFNWGTLPVTSLARTDTEYVEAEGPYDGRAWFGDVWTMRNLPIIAGLEDAGRHALAAELTWATIKAFNGRYAEFLVPSTGSGEGVQRYGWSASQYIQAVVEHLFGVDVDLIEGRLRVFPHIPQDLWGRNLALEGLLLPGTPAQRLDLSIQAESRGRADVWMKIDPPWRYGVEVVVPLDEGAPTHAAYDDGRDAVLQTFPALRGAVGVRAESCQTLHITFE
jgi:hypothetical protein